jgi:hypothetical protein
MTIGSRFLELTEEEGDTYGGRGDVDLGGDRDEKHKEEGAEGDDGERDGGEDEEDEEAEEESALGGVFEHRGANGIIGAESLLRVASSVALSPIRTTRSIQHLTDDDDGGGGGGLVFNLKP